MSRIEELLEELDEIQDDTPKKYRQKFPRLLTEVEVPCDVNRLYGPLDVSVTYLQEVRTEHPEAQLDENWTGYEDMEMRFVYYKPMNDEAYLTHLRLNLESLKRLKEDAKKAAEKEAIRKQIAVLQAKL